MINPIFSISVLSRLHKTIAKILALIKKTCDNDHFYTNDLLLEVKTIDHTPTAAIAFITVRDKPYDINRLILQIVISPSVGESVVSTPDTWDSSLNKKNPLIQSAHDIISFLKEEGFVEQFNEELLMGLRPTNVHGERKFIEKQYTCMKKGLCIKVLMNLVVG